MLSNTLLPNPLGSNSLVQVKNTLNLTQIEGFLPIQEFTDTSNTKWNLVKSFQDSSIDIPDPKSIQIMNYWNHEFPNLKEKIYIYVVEGIKQPRVETEQPTRILYQWFSNLFVPTFNPQMISDKEWLKANVYAASVMDTRVSILQALCHIDTPVEVENNTTGKLLRVEGLNEERSNPRADGKVQS